MTSGGVTVLGEVGYNYLCCVNFSTPATPISAGQTKEFDIPVTGYPVDNIQWAIGTVSRNSGSGLQKFIIGSTVATANGNISFNSTCYAIAGSETIKVLVYSAEDRSMVISTRIYFTSPKP